MAFVDLKTKKIYGCKKNSYTWWHEKGHIVFNNSKIGNYIDFWKGNLFYWSFAGIVLGVFLENLFFKFFAFSTFITYSLLYLYEEIWCWIYSLKNKRKKDVSSTSL